MQLLTWDTGILAALGLLLAYSLLLRKHKALATLVSVYVAYLITSSFGSFVVQFFTGDRVLFKSVWIQANLSAYSIQAVLLVITALLISTFMKLGGKKLRYSALEVTLYAIATLALSIMFIISFMPPETRDTAFAGSHILPLVYQFRQWVLGIPVLLMVIFGIFKSEES